MHFNIKKSVGIINAGGGGGGGGGGGLLSNKYSQHSFWMGNIIGQSGESRLRVLTGLIMTSESFPYHIILIIYTKSLP